MRLHINTNSGDCRLSCSGVSNVSFCEKVSTCYEIRMGINMSSTHVFFDPSRHLHEVTPSINYPSQFLSFSSVSSDSSSIII